MVVADLLAVCPDNLDVELWQDDVLIESYDGRNSLSGTYDDELVDHIETDINLLMIYI